MIPERIIFVSRGITVYDKAYCTNVHFYVHCINLAIPFMHEYWTYCVLSCDCCRNQCLPVSVCKQAVLKHLWFASYVQIMSWNQPHCLSHFPHCSAFAGTFYLLRYIHMKLNKYMRRSIQFLAQIQTGFSHDQRNECSLSHATGRLACRSATHLTWQ